MEGSLAGEWKHGRLPIFYSKVNKPLVVINEKSVHVLLLLMMRLRRAHTEAVYQNLDTKIWASLSLHVQTKCSQKRANQVGIVQGNSRESNRVFEAMQF